MDNMSTDQLKAKIVYLTEENNKLRDALLDAQILLGQIALDTPTHTPDNSQAGSTEHTDITAEVVSN